MSTTHSAQARERIDTTASPLARAQPGIRAGLIKRTFGRPWFFVLHSVLGLYLSLFMGVVCLTGTVATVSHEIEWLLLPHTRGTPTGSPAPWGAQWDAARAAYPHVTLDRIAKKGTESMAETYLATAVSGVDRDGGRIAIYVNPANGTVQGATDGVTFHSFMRGLHYYLFDPGGVMFYAVTLLGPVLLLSAITGIKLYRQWWRGFFRAPAGTKPRLWWGQLHKLMAVWSLPFVFVIGLTSVWYLLERNPLEWEGPYPALDEPMRPLDRHWTGEDIDRFAAIAIAALPGLRITTIYLPWDAMSPVQVQGTRGNLFVRNRANRVAIDPRSLAVLEVQRPEDMNSTRRWVHTADPLHFGDFGGLATKLLWVAWGLALTGLCLSGATVYAKRMASARRPAAGAGGGA